MSKKTICVKIVTDDELRRMTKARLKNYLHRICELHDTETWNSDCFKEDQYIRSKDDPRHAELRKRVIDAILEIEGR